MVEDGTQLFEELMRVRPEGLTPNAWAVKAGVSRTIWQDLRRHGNPSRRTLEKLLVAAGSSLAEFEALRIGDVSPAVEIVAGAGVGEAASPFRDARMLPIPLVSSKAAGEWGVPGSGLGSIQLDPSVVLDHLPRPTSMASDPDGFALVVTCDDMWPRFRRGRRVAVSPVAQIEVGDDVLVMLREPRGSARRAPALLKELAGCTASSLVLRQFTPAMTFELPLGQVISVQKVLGELI
jgi:phage repressor protein C with HTH and peptisase S24 domain